MKSCYVKGQLQSIDNKTGAEFLYRARQTDGSFSKVPSFLAGIYDVL